MKDLARYGAQARIVELQRELNEILLAFPDLKKDGNLALAAPSQAAGRARRRKPMTTAQRKAVGERMRKYWAARRKEKKG